MFTLILAIIATSLAVINDIKVDRLTAVNDKLRAELRRERAANKRRL